MTPTHLVVTTITSPPRDQPRPDTRVRHTQGYPSSPVSPFPIQTKRSTDQSTTTIKVVSSPGTVLAPTTRDRGCYKIDVTTKSSPLFPPYVYVSVVTVPSHGEVCTTSPSFPFHTDVCVGGCLIKHPIGTHSRTPVSPYFRPTSPPTRPRTGDSTETTS